MRFRNIRHLCVAYKRLEARGNYLWASLDREVVGICDRFPNHADVGEVYAKVAIINRTYRANLQLGAGDAERKVAARFVKGNVDEVVSPLRQVSQFSGEVLPAVLEAHGKVAKIAGTVTKRVENSFASKYLHFHFPDIVPMFDNRAYNESWRLAPVPESEWRQIGKRSTYAYGYHCHSLLEIMRRLQDLGVGSPRLNLLDVLLYG